MVDWQNHAGRTVALGFGVGFLLFVIHILLWLVDQVGNPSDKTVPNFILVTYRGALKRSGHRLREPAS